MYDADESDRLQSSAGLAADSQQIVPTPPARPSRAGELARTAAELGLSEHANDTEALKSELQKIVLALHPDKTRGEFKSDQDKSRFMKARKAVEILNGTDLDEDGSAAASQLPGSIRAIGDASRRWRSPAATRRIQLRFMADARARISRYFAGPKTGAAVCGAVTLVLGMFPDLFERNPVFGPLLARPDTVTFLFAMALVSAIVFVALWMWERSDQQRVEHLMSEAALGEILEQARRCADRYGRAERLSAFDIRRAIEILLHGARDHHPSRAARLSYRGLDGVTLENISAMQTQRLLERRVLKVLNTPSIEVLYEVSPLGAQL